MGQPTDKITYHTRFRVFPYLLMASIAFFLPLTASRVYETTYVLSFKAINNCMIQATLAITSFFLMVLVSAIPSVKLLKVFLPAATVISILCQVVIALTQSESSLFALHQIMSSRSQPLLRSQTPLFCYYRMVCCC